MHFRSSSAFALVAAASGLMEEVYARKALWIPLAILAWLAMIGIMKATHPRGVRYP